MGKNMLGLKGLDEGLNDKYEMLGVDWQAKTLYVPNWGWGLAAAYAAYRLFFAKRRGRR